MAHKSQPHSFGSIGVRTPLVVPGQRIGVMGGSFNPPHEGHLIVARTALKRLQLDWLWWLVTPGNPLKTHDDLAPLNARMSAIRAMTSDPRMVLTSFEDQLATPYTAATLAFLKLRYASARFVWIMGADNLATFHRWQRWRDVATAMPFAVVDRPGWRLRALASPAARILEKYRIDEAHASELPLCQPPAWTFLTTRLSPLSSTELRSRRLAIVAEKPRPDIETVKIAAI
ncbi:putative nicotinate-nucleotide adenylyltransferase [Candidatus Filomicrobium marinum]|uniref:Probable nicotinate-nucleotide adenylyltransferase n=2 Tax=Filomicrobium TaxID=119044 RepID=A0A0D6JE25_9HYPH|nr:MULTISPECIES: nicotinate-nucleotide adenylyltransferase [Filomicrobium]CFX14012.1 putative nicotinate-nucleotide adenylyltransferase [Candidatus Filomicrobium marinum]CPR17705.1 putative nicotinate-nucleotide adenylyltransferase [Candidatus Filomicrobium marinum]SDO29441.1 nicotinate-nucleotide adenylyltransferase [Filomicrobium insigne]